ncbi:MAG: 4-hydroxythreonine-4-phosphate dehydrogenase PdxA [Gammaproteobacteria bacterium]
MSGDGKKTVAITAGDPAGIGADLCLDICAGDYSAPLVFIGDKNALAARARMRGVSFAAEEYRAEAACRRAVLHCPAPAPVVCGALSPDNAAHVLAQLRRGAEGCLSGEFSALVTAPVNKDIICAAGFDFAGQTEYLAACAKTPHPVMLLASPKMRVALAVRHLPLAQTAAALNEDDLTLTLKTLDAGLRRYFTDGRAPRIAVAGLNPHAGEGGRLGREETEIIRPALARAVRAGVLAEGPFSADSMFHFVRADCFLAMYHDQGLPVIKYADFDNTVNITLGLPFFRASPAHGTAAALAGTGDFSPDSMRAAVRLAMDAK